jgi:type I restriction enzyme, S subunit
MNRIEELIEQLCPEGVEYKNLIDVCERNHGTNITANRMKAINKKNGKIKIYAGGNTIAFVDYADIPLNDIIKKQSIIVKSRGNIGFEYYSLPFSHKNELWSYSKKIDSINLKYIYYLLSSSIYSFQQQAKNNSVKMPQLCVSDTDNFEIPIPPRPVQNEIVKILDNFTSLTAELQAELQARKSQYEFYRNKLLTFGRDGENPSSLLSDGSSPSLKDNSDLSAQDPHRDSHTATTIGQQRGVKWMKLGNCAKCLTGATPKTSNKSYWKNGNIPWMNSGEVNSGRVFNVKNTITEEGYKSCSTHLVPPKTIVVALAGQGKTRGMVAITEIELCTNQSLCSIITSETINPYFLCYFLHTQYNNLRNISSGDGSRGGLTLKMINDFEIPIPPITEQERIVSILDKYDALVNDVRNGLPAEIEARQKQYEYYRDKLLIFKRKEV